MSFNKSSGFEVMASCTPSSGVGYGDTIPWMSEGCTADARHINRTTAYHEDPSLVNAVIMGYNLWKSLGKKPLKLRVNVVLTRSPEVESPMLHPGVIFAPSLDRALEQLEARGDVGRVYVIGGESTFDLAMRHPRCTKLHLAVVKSDKVCDRYLDSSFIHANYEMQQGPQHLVTEGKWDITFAIYDRKSNSAIANMLPRLKQ